MAWNTEMPFILRNLLLDVATPPLYADSQLATLILIAGLGLLTEAAFVNSYQISIDNTTISPDPTVPASRDIAFINLACLKSAFRLVTAEIRDLARQGIEIQDGSSRIKLSRDPASLKLMRDTYQKDYEDALYAFKTGGNDGLGEAVVSPYKYWSNWSTLGMAGMFEGYPADRWTRGNIGGFY